MDELLKEAQRLNISTTKKISIVYGDFSDSARHIANDILKFLDKNNLQDAYWEGHVRRSYGDTETEVEIYNYIPKSESELRTEIEARKKAEEGLKSQRRAQYELLKKEFE